MAIVEQDRAGGKRNKRTGAKAPISAHPAFAVIVALWFAALLGIGSLILPIAVIERLVVASGLPSILSAAQPPLGFTARAGIALAATVAGGIIGLIVALQVARSHRTAIANRSTNPSDLIRRPPVNAHAELGSEGFDGNGTSRRRALSLAADEADETAKQVHEFREAAQPQPQPQDLELDDTLALENALPPAADLSAPAPLRFAEPAFEVVPGDATDEHALADQEVFAADGDEDFVHNEEPTPVPFAQPASFAQPFEADAAEPQPESPEPLAEEQRSVFSSPAMARPATRAEREDLAELGLVQLVQKLEATIEKHRAWLIEKNQRAAEAAADDLPEPASLDTEEAFGTIAPDEAAQARQAYFDAPAPAPLSADDNSGESKVEEDQDRDSSARATAADSHRAPIASLAAFTPEHDNEDEDDEAAAALSASFAMPFASPAAKRQVLEASSEAVAEAGTGSEDEGNDSNESFASLKGDFAQRPLRAVRIEEPESEDGEEAAVVFPGQSARSFDAPKAVSSVPHQPRETAPTVSSEETDQALREALRNLQRMGKAS
ncbi:hypothetical protein [Aurantiacibacter flavus]|uniref:DUF308 domain-containing protein n=1 Tax=Aurantiacibacter flavus TaxID=3145232 RepID=A0ABV0CZH0_9SPHN